MIARLAARMAEAARIVSLDVPVLLEKLQSSTVLISLAAAAIFALFHRLVHTYVITVRFGCNREQ